MFPSLSTPTPSPDRIDAAAPRNARSPLKVAGFLWRVFPRERRYAELGYLLPFYLGLAVKTRCVGPSSWHALYIYRTTVRTFGYNPDGHRS